MPTRRNGRVSDVDLQGDDSGRVGLPHTWDIRAGGNPWTYETTMPIERLEGDERGRDLSLPAERAGTTVAHSCNTALMQERHWLEGTAPPDAASAVGLTAEPVLPAVVTDGRATFLGDVPGAPVAAKTGTADSGEPDADGTLATHARMTGIQGHLAVAVLVERGCGGAGAAGPVLTDVRYGGAVALNLLLTVLLTGCGSAVTADVGDDAAAALQEAVARAHERALDVRAVDPTAAGTTAAEDVADAITGGNASSQISATAAGDGVQVVTSVGVRVERGGGLFYEEASLGACLLTSVTAGSAAGTVGERGTVTTEAVACPDGVTPATGGTPVQTTVDIARLESPVPMARAAPCFSGSGDCGGGG